MVCWLMTHAVLFYLSCCMGDEGVMGAAMDGVTAGVGSLGGQG